MAVKGFRKRKDGSSYPIIERKGERYSGQTSDPSWKESSIRDLHKEEVASSKHYGKMAKTAPTKTDARTMKGMSKDEARHARNLRRIDPQKGCDGSCPTCSQTRCWYHPQGNLEGWKKTQDAEARRAHAISSTPRNMTLDHRREIARKRLQSLANVTTDESTKEKAQADAYYFSELRERTSQAEEYRKLRPEEYKLEGQRHRKIMRASTIYEKSPQHYGE